MAPSAAAAAAAGGVGPGLGVSKVLFILLSIGAIAAVAARTRSKKRRRSMSYALGPDGKHVDIGAIFGLDVGGTLSKLVYFEQTRKSRKVERTQQQKRRSNYFDNPLKKATTLKRSASLENLNTPRHTKALDAFYDFMQAEGSPVRAELRDDNLTFFSRVLGGELHFMRFETRYMDRVVDIVKSNRLHHSINSMGCTGGGAYKFSDLFQERLGITLRKMDELDCLMRGLEFVLQHVVGECYTYKPDKSLTMPLPSPGSSGLDHRMSWRGSYAPAPAPAPTPPSSTSSSSTSSSTSSSPPPPLNPALDIPPLPKGKMSRPGALGTSTSSPTVMGDNAASAASAGKTEPYAFSVEDDDSGLGLSLDGQSSFDEEGGPEASPRLRSFSSSSSSTTSSSPGSPSDGEEPRRPPQSSGSANSNTLKQEWKYKVQRSGEHVIYPYLVVNIGSGVSILKVEGPGKYERISGSSLGGGTYWGLCRLLTGCKTFDEVLDLAEMGDSDVVDMTVGDIYGRGYDKFHLSPSVIASSFGKLATRQDPGEGIKAEDMARALLMMITGNIGQVAYLNAVIHRATHIYFVGNFLRHNKISCRRLAYAIDYWSAGKMEALFLEHEGYFGSLGAFLNSSYVEDLHAHTQEAAGGLAQTVGPGVVPTGSTSGAAAEAAATAAAGAAAGAVGGGGKGGGKAGKAARAAIRLRKQESSPLPTDPGMRGGGGRRVESLRLEKSYGGFLDPAMDEGPAASPPSMDAVLAGGDRTSPSGAAAPAAAAVVAAKV